MNRVAVKNVMIARRSTPVVLDVRSQGAQRRKRAFLTQPARDKALRAACGVRLLVKGFTIYFVALGEALNQSAMNRVADRFEKIARRTPQVVLAVRSQGVQHSKYSNLWQPMGTGFTGGLLRQAPGEGNGHSRRRRTSIPSAKASCAAMWDWFRASLASHPAPPLSRPCGTCSGLPKS